MIVLNYSNNNKWINLVTNKYFLCLIIENKNINKYIERSK